MSTVVLAAPSDAGFSHYLAAERSVQRHDRALAGLVSALEEWLSGRQGAEPTRKAVRALRVELGSKLDLPGPVAKTVRTSQDRMLSSVERFLAQTSPDAEGQRSLFEALNGATRDRAEALLRWRFSRNAELSKSRKSGPKSHYLTWEARWLEIWKSEVDVTFRLQKAFLQSQAGQGASGQSYVGELLALQAKAEKVTAPKDLEALSNLAKKRLTLLARAAEQLERVGAGSRGALARLRKLNKEQTEMTRQMQEQRLGVLSRLVGQS